MVRVFVFRVSLAQNRCPLLCYTIWYSVDIIGRFICCFAGYTLENNCARPETFRSSVAIMMNGISGYHGSSRPGLR